MIGSPLQVAAANAVMANGTLAHGFDYDDTLEEAIVHTGCCAGMTALAVGEEIAPAVGRAEAVIAGTEVCAKSVWWRRENFTRAGFHPTAICSTFGAAAAAGKFYGLTLNQWVDAFGLCGSQSSGHHRISRRRHLDQAMHPGWSAHGGVIATMLAREGFRGPAKVFEGTHGFFAAFGGRERIPIRKI